MARITDISDSSTENKNYNFDEPTMKRERNKTMTLIFSAGVVLMIAVVAAVVYYWLWQKKQTLVETRLQPATQFEEANSRKMAPDQLPQDLELKQAVDMYNRGY
ncbi:MAG TPA: hypothetical protein PLY93_12600, partial [Turneriella sp.]|nr:hypothetical protein [Turneriella sp.]